MFLSQMQYPHNHNNTCHYPTQCDVGSPVANCQSIVAPSLRPIMDPRLRCHSLHAGLLKPSSIVEATSTIRLALASISLSQLARSRSPEFDNTDAIAHRIRARLVTEYDSYLRLGIS